MSILDEAAQAVDRDRQEDYGHPYDDFRKVTGAAKALGVDPLSGPLHHALYMVLVKVARLVETPDHHDSIVDVAGYARTYELCLEVVQDVPDLEEPNFRNTPDFWEKAGSDSA